VRTSHHPSAHLVLDAPGGAASFDHVYEHKGTFADVYASITEQLVEAARTHGHVLYAVPGSPLVLERSVRHLMSRDDVEVDVLPAMSFLDLAYAALRVDPVEAGVRLIDGHEFATAAAGHSGPLLVAHTHANWVLSDIKLAVEDAAGDEPVVILQRLGTADESVVHTTWAELDRTVEADHLTCIYVPHLAAPVGAELVAFHQLARTCASVPVGPGADPREPRALPVEETYEVVDALQALDSDDPRRRRAGRGARRSALPDRVPRDDRGAGGRFTMADVARGVHDKLVRRHPHVFGVQRRKDSDDRAAELGRDQARGEAAHECVRRRGDVAAVARVRVHRATQGGEGRLRLADVSGALAKISEEAAEVVEAAASGERGAVADEVGDLLFAVVNVARHLDVEPEAALRAAVGKFRRRFEQVEQIARERGVDLHASDLATLDALWDEVKAAQPQ
jgi:tetrapyrrole methylase family protein/MazG family protein